MTTELDSLHSALGEAERYAKDLDQQLSEAISALLNMVDMARDLVPGELDLEGRPEMITANAVLEFHRRTALSPST